MLNELAKDIHDLAVSKGWYDEQRSFGEVIALCHSELSEALEEHRNGSLPYYIKNGKPEGEAVELIDCMIRILDYCGHKNYNVDHIFNVKHSFNRGRPYRHGNKTL